MEKVNLGYSTKNIPFPSERNYRTKLIEQIEAFLKRMRWKAIFYNIQNGEEQEKIPQNYGLKTTKCPAQVKELIPFENDLFQLAKNVKFRRTNNEFQQKLKIDTRNIRNSQKTLTPADKTSNMYRLSKEEYENFRTNAITAKYKKASKNLKEKVDKSGLKFAKKAGVADRMEINATNHAFITLKDHKENFQNNPTTRLINPAKNEVGRVSKVILDRINSELKVKTEVNQWKSTGNVIDWFNKIEDKSSYTFTVFDIKDFYPSITESLLKEALDFAKRHTTVKKEEIDLIMHSRKSLLFNKDGTWIKRSGGLFDVTMGAYDGAEVCELVGTYMLNLLAERCDRSEIGLYRDDGLAVFKNKSGPELERIKKFIQKTFKDKGLELIIQCNMKITNYLDITMNLTTGTTSPYRKPDDETTYIHADSDHPPNIIQQLPLSVEKRLSALSSSESIFNEAKGYYQDALQRNGHSHRLTYKPPIPRRRVRRKDILWFNPPFSKTVETNVGRKFLQLIDKHFPENNNLQKIFNRKTVKVSYGCMPNIGAVISAHNKKILEDRKTLERGPCNCNRENRENCPLDGECMTSNVMYEAKLSSTEEGYREKDYVGITQPPWKGRLGNHNRDFSNEEYKNTTELSKEVWRIKNKGFVPKIKWKIVKQIPAYNPEMKKCLLCLGEKVEILERESVNLLNKKSELVSKCRHKNKFMLNKYDVT